MTLRKVRMELARDQDFPQGSAAHGYEFTAPLTAEGYIDAEAWRKDRRQCTVRRFWAGEDDQSGHLIRTQGRSWVFHYDISTGDATNRAAVNADVVREPGDDEAGFKFDHHVFRVGEYVSVHEQDGSMRTFRVTKVGLAPSVSAS
jgi:hypothetical protein